ncbi:hypothetical protein OAQ99_08040, partial [Candidatus Kapabacteria bacterium]|nr:hypothetical protein [Candidatus Kapabacteria bacterium]
MNFNLDRFSIIIAMSINLIAIFFFYENASFGSKFVYALDDPYIHLQIAKNLAEFGTFGINAGNFESASSSPIWNLLLYGIIELFGNSDKIPFFINLTLVFPVIYMINRILISIDFKGFRPVILTGISLSISIPSLVIIGMEHLLHILLVLVLLNQFLKFLDNKKISMIIVPILLVIGLVRYESLFLTTLFPMVLFYKKDRLKSFIIFALPLLSILIFGVYSIQNGGYFLPNSLLIKSGFRYDSIFNLLYNFYTAISKIIDSYSISNLIMLCLLVSYLSLKKTFPTELIFLVSLIIIHALFASFGWLFRYEAYLIAIGIPILILSFTKLKIKLSKSLIL